MNNTGNTKTLKNRVKNVGKKLANVRNKMGAKLMNLGYTLKNKYNSTFQKGGKKTRKASGRRRR